MKKFLLLFVIFILIVSAKNLNPLLPDPIKEPGNLTADSSNPGKVILSWTDQSNNEKGFYIMRGDSVVNTFQKVGEVGADITTFTDVSISENMRYKYKVKAFNDSTESGYSNEVEVIIGEVKIKSPSDLGGHITPERTVQLGWKDNSDDEDGFEIERASAKNSEFSKISSVDRNVTSYIDNYEDSTETYKYRVRAFKQGEYSDYSNEFVLEGKKVDTLITPSNLSAQLDDEGNITLQWTDNSDDETGFKLERTDSVSNGYFIRADLEPNVTSYKDTTAKKNDLYKYRIAAVRDGETSAYSNEVEILVHHTVATPENLTADASVFGQLNLNWVDKSDNETGFRIERKDRVSVDFFHLSDVAENATEFTDTSALGDSLYTYRVKAFNSLAESEYTNEASAVVYIKINAPTNLSGEKTDSGFISLSWQDNSDNEEGFILERMDNVSQYFNIKINLPANSVSYVDKNVNDSDDYTYKVSAFNKIFNSASSNEFTIKADSIEQKDSVSIAAPSNLIVLEMTESFIKLKWDDNSDNEDGFSVEKKYLWESDFYEISKTEKNENTFLSDVNGDTSQVEFRVRAFKSDKFSDYSNIVDATPITGINKLDEEIPTDFSLQQNYPNPFNPETRIRFSVPEESEVVISVYNLIGQLIEVITEEESLPPGNYVAIFRAEDIPSGIYLYQMRTKKIVLTRKMILLK